MDDNLKYQQMQDEMSRFEAEISDERRMLPAPRPVIGANTYNSVQQRLGQSLLPPPLPPAMPPGVFNPGLMMDGGMYGAIPPPPPPPTMLIPPQLRTRPPVGMGLPQVMPQGFPPVLGPFMPPAPPPKPQPAVLSGAPQLYRNKTEKTKKKDTAAAEAKALAAKLEEEAKELALKEAQKKAQAAAPEPEAPTQSHTAAANNATPSGNTTGQPPHKLSKKEKKNRKVIRTAGGQVWEDTSLLEWQDEDFRLFCGDLGNDVTDELLVRTFSKYASFSKAKVVRDKRTNKSKGFGFISFKEPADFIKAMKEMNGRYVGSRPIKLRKSTWQARSLDVVKKKEKEKAALISLFTSGASKP